ncbi:MAG TPA: hypothetical protein VFO67_13465 [Gemmatimonadales bacterium]|nr:hypothetical protein [Gemmatimonadales bacterium]
MTRSLPVWLSALWIGALIHVDWHAGRPGHDHLSFGLSYHWLLGVLTFAPVPWLLVRRWPNAFVRASVLGIALGVLIGQGIEPLSEVILFGAGSEPFTNSVRWRVFAEFISAGLVTYIVCGVLAVKETRVRGLTRA